MRLILVRHGDSLHGQSGRILGKNDCPGLSATGFKQVELLALRFHAYGERFDLVLSSPYLRARQTADGVCSVLGQAYEVDDDLTEQRYGTAEGLTREEYQIRYGKFDFIAEPDRPVAPGGESWNGFLARVNATLERLAGQHPERTILAFTHAGFIVGTFLEMFDIPRPSSRPRAWIDPQHTSLTEWTWKQGIWKLARYNDTAHRLPFEETK